MPSNFVLTRPCSCRPTRKIEQIPASENPPVQDSDRIFYTKLAILERINSDRIFYTKLAILERINGGICEVPGIDRASIFNKPGTKDEYGIARYHKDLPLCDALALFMVAAPSSDVAAVAFLRKNPAYTRVLITK